MDDTAKFEHWQDIAKYDLDTADAMYQAGRYLYVVFMCQQSIEKPTKGLHILNRGEEAPRTHNIYAVFKKVFDPSQKDEEFIEKEKEYAPFFAELLAYYISERYPSYREKLSSTIKQKKAEEVLKQTKEVFTWLQSLRKL
ncbi:HEPN domain-containing protein [Virgibacillus sp. CBA3643]|uniref:HEPN domain-containing protein n=1 Tax=Virgibacillus sp. CBA3643 TaxID=2942278 RepID=UPI0035A270F5